MVVVVVMQLQEPQLSDGIDGLVAADHRQVACHQPINLFGRDAEEDKVTKEVQASTASSTHHLAELRRVEQDVITSKHNGSAWAVDTQREGLGGKDDVAVHHAEQLLSMDTKLAGNASVVDRNAALEGPSKQISALIAVLEDFLELHCLDFASPDKSELWQDVRNGVVFGFVDLDGLLGLLDHVAVFIAVD